MRCVFTIVIRSGPQFKRVSLYSESLPYYCNEVIRNSFIRLSVLLVTSFINAAVRRFCTLSIYVIPLSCQFYNVRSIKCIMLIPITKWTSWFWKTWMNTWKVCFNVFLNCYLSELILPTGKTRPVLVIPVGTVCVLKCTAYLVKPKRCWRDITG